MSTLLLRRGTKVSALLCALTGAATAALSGCGDGITCQTEILVAFQAPAGLITADADPAVAGVQTTIPIRSTLGAGKSAVLTVEVDGMTVTTVTATTDADGDATFEGVTVPTGGALLRVVADDGACGRAEDTLTVEVTAGADCALELADEPAEVPFYAPLGVLNASLDGAPATPGYQGDVVLRTNPSHTVALFVTVPGGLEQQVGTGVADASGELRLPVSLPDGQNSLRAQCAAPGGAFTRSTALTAVIVDTTAPTCAVTSPVPTTSLTPSLDGDADLSNGLQLTLAARAAGGDTEGEPASFVLTPPGGSASTLPADPLAADGTTDVDASFDPATTPADFGVRFEARDHAGNPCSASYTYRVVYDGCPIVVTGPTGPVTADADPATPGAQLDIGLDVADECIGRAITSDCGSDDPGAPVGAGGVASLRATLCAGLPCEAVETCTVRVTSPDGIETTAGVDLRFDNRAPNVAIQVAAPVGVTCGQTITPGDDADPATAGVQVSLRVVAPLATTRQLRLSSNGGPIETFDASAAGGEVVATVVPGSNAFVGVAADDVGNTATTPTCAIALADVAVGFTGAAADGLVGGADGAVAGGSVTFDLTGTVSEAGATIAIAVDGGAAVPATVTGTTWRVSLTLAAQAAPHSIVASATVGPRLGSATLAVTVDLTGPTAVGGLAATAPNHRAIRATFTAPSDGGGAAAGYRIRYATTALTDGNFDSTGTVVSGPAPGAPGAAQTVTIPALRAGTGYWIGVAALDAAGNRSTAQVVGPITPDFDRSAAYAAPNSDGEVNFGLSVVRGRFNDDEFEDVAVGAPYANVGPAEAAGEVYVYFGSATGLGTVPAVTIRGGTPSGNLGSSLARVRWSSSTRDDLVVGEPFGDGGNGEVHVFDGGASLPSGAVTTAAAERHVRTDPAAAFFNGSGFGWALASADHDGDGTDDLVATAIFADAGVAGAALVFYGGTVPTGDVIISDVDAGGSGSAVIRMYDQPVAFFGAYLVAVGRTQGGADGTDDLAVGMFEDGAPGAELYVLRGAGRPGAPGITREPFTVGRDVRIVQPLADDTLEWGSAVGSIADQNGDGARELVLGDYRVGVNADAGVVYVLDGDTVGTGGVATLGDPGLVLTELTLPDNFPETQLGMAIVNNASGGGGDVDGDGREDLIVAGRPIGTGQAALFVWYGPVPTGLQSPATPDHLIAGPASFTGARPPFGGTPINAIWAGDVNGDGLQDICWTDWMSVDRDGGLQVLWDDGN